MSHEKLLKIGLKHRQREKTDKGTIESNKLFSVKYAIKNVEKQIIKEDIFNIYNMCVYIYISYKRLISKCMKNICETLKDRQPYLRYKQSTWTALYKRRQLISIEIIFCIIQYQSLKLIYNEISLHQGFSGSSADKESTCNAGDTGLIPELGRSPGEGIGYPLQYSRASLVPQLVKNL